MGPAAYLSYYRKHGVIMNRRVPYFKRVLIVLYILALGTFLFFLIRGSTYYSAPYSERPFHPDYRALKPAGSTGLWFGVAGASMMLLLLLYSLRKRIRLLKRFFLLKYWLDIHILFGITGPLFILLHTSFKLNGLVAVSFWSMMAVAGSGVLGRYLYIQIPRNIKGDELGIRELEERNERLTGELVTRFGLTNPAVASMMTLLQGDQRVSSNGSLVHMIASDVKRQWQLRKARRKIPTLFEVLPDHVDALVATVLRKSSLQRKMARRQKVHKLFHYWHVIHRPFALVMYLIMAVHIVVALLFGISWRTT